MKKVKIGSEQYHIFDQWKELPFNSYLEIAEISQRKQNLLLNHNKLLDLVMQQADEYERIQFDASYSAEEKAQAQAFITKRTEQYVLQIEKINEQVIDIWIKIVQFMSNIPIHLIVQFDTATPKNISFLDANWDNIEITSQHLAYYISLCTDLLSKPMPINKPIEKFKWQTACDEKITELQNEYNQLSFIKKCRYVGRSLKAEIQKAKSSKIQIPELLSQTTLSNRELMRAYESAQKEIENNNLKGLKTIIAILLVESEQFNDAIIEARKSNNLDTYRNAYMMTYQRVSDILWNQAKSLDCETVFGIAAFFLSRSKTSTNPIKMFFDLVKILKT